ncbi:MAG: hypothetical protein JSR48_09105 [Verrucomicrobia bacterium]|nr:hypothetical protein [Verrucomicrobiota bacterium]
MIGWLADFFRLAWGLLYWNSRKSWFRLRRGRTACPCQSPSDSGRALETQCEAMVTWQKPERFRRVCPLLVHTPQGWRCSADTADVRPFWGRALGYYGGTILGTYLALALAVFIFLRAVGYPVSIFQVAWPGSWHRVGQARGWYFTERARQAFAANRTAEAVLYLSNAYEFDPSNYAAGLTLAKVLQSGQPIASNRIYERLYREHRPQQEATAEDWFRALLARGDFPGICALAKDRLLHDTPTASAWMRALVFASEQSASDQTLRSIREVPALAAWRPLIDAELLALAGRKAEARAALDRPNWDQIPPYGVYYRISRLIEAGSIFQALDVLGTSAGRLDPETTCTLQLEAFARQDAQRLRRQLFERLLADRLTGPSVKVLTAHLIRHPESSLFDRLCTQFQRAPLPFNTDNAPAYFSLLCAAGCQGDWIRFGEMGRVLTKQSGLSPALLLTVENFFRGRSTTDRVVSILPALPLPVELDYALIERYPGRQSTATSRP